MSRASPVIGRPRRKTVLFCWELGAGRGHMLPMRPLVERLAQSGHHVCLAMRDCGGAAAVFTGVEVSLLQAPYYCGVRAGPRRTLNFSYILANEGWGTDADLTGLTSAWRNLLGYVKPDVLVVDHSPTALLAARCLPAWVGKVVMAPGFFCPPDVSPFPVIVAGDVDLDQLAADEQEIVARANRVLARWKTPPLTRLGQLYSQVDETILTTFPELDHYPQRPSAARYWGPVHTPGGKAPQWPDRSGKRIFAYLFKSPALEGVLAALSERDESTIVVADGLDPAMRQRFESTRMRFETQRLDMARVRAECDLAVLNSNHGTLCQLLLGGRPMLQVPVQLEQQVLARAVQRTGAAETATWRGEQAGDEIRAKLAAVASEPKYAEAARRFADRYADFDPAQQLDRMAARVEGLLKRRSPEPGWASAQGSGLHDAPGDDGSGGMFRP